jgi:hypothetical protein
MFKPEGFQGTCLEITVHKIGTWRQLLMCIFRINCDLPCLAPVIADIAVQRESEWGS